MVFELKASDILKAYRIFNTYGFEDANYNVRPHKDTLFIFFMSRMVRIKSDKFNKLDNITYKIYSVDVSNFESELKENETISIKIKHNTLHIGTSTFRIEKMHEKAVNANAIERCINHLEAISRENETIGKGPICKVPIKYLDGQYENIGIKNNEIYHFGDLKTGSFRKINLPESLNSELAFKSRYINIFRYSDCDYINIYKGISDTSNFIVTDDIVLVVLGSDFDSLEKFKEFIPKFSMIIDVSFVDYVDRVLLRHDSLVPGMDIGKFNLKFTGDKLDINGIEIDNIEHSNICYEDDTSETQQFERMISELRYHLKDDDRQLKLEMYNKYFKLISMHGEDKYESFIGKVRKIKL